MKMDSLRNLENDDRTKEPPQSGRDKAMNSAVMRGQAGGRAPLGIPKNYIPLPQGNEYVRQSYAYMNGAGRSLFKQWTGPTPTRLQARNLPTPADDWHAQQHEWLRQTGRRRFSNFTNVQDLGKNYATNESAQAAFSQRQLTGRPHSETQFYAFLRGMSAMFGSLE